MNLKVMTAIVACRAVRLLARVLHRGGTAKPGEIALKICPELLHILSRDVECVVVTGTNGKTTTCRMLEQAFAEAGEDCIVNRSGANLMSGITTEFVMCSTLRGKCRKKYAVMECDEGWTKKVLPALQPRVFLVTNLFQDQVDRYGDVANTLAALRAGVAECPNTVLCLNADDPITASLAVGATTPVVWYGLEAAAGETGAVPGAAEVTNCILCGAPLAYDYVTYAHLGGYRCPDCGHARPATDVGVEVLLELGPDSSTVRLRIHGETRELTVNQPAVYNVCNAAGAIAAAMAMGLTADAAVAAVERFDCGFGRMEKFRIGAAGARMVLVKNAAGCNQVLRFLATQTQNFDLVMITNNRGADGTDVSWLADAEFERLAELPRLGAVILSGICAETVRQRLLKAGLPEERLTVEPDYAALTERLAAARHPVFILPSYTGMMEFRAHLVKKCGGREFWE